MNSKPIDGPGELHGRRFSDCASFWKSMEPEFGTPEARTFETEGDAIESDLRWTIEGET
jgi:hypothetical protein